MSDIYLTKIERKTIFTKSLIFVLIMFVISDLTVTGPFYFNFIPWFFVIGIVGKVKRIDKFLMGLIGTFTVLIATIITEKAVNLMCLINVIASVVLLTFGIITGRIITEFVLEHRLVKYIKPRKKVLYILVICLVTVVSFGIVCVKDGSLFGYINAKNNLNKYLNSTYQIDSYIIKDIKYERKLKGKYIFTLEVDGQVVKFVESELNKYTDLNREERLNKINTKLRQEFNDKLKNIDYTKYPLLKNIDTRCEMEYTKVEINPNGKNIYISLNNEIDKIDEIYEELQGYIEEIVKMESCDKIILTVNGKTLEIYKEKFEGVTLEYLQGGFSIEELDNYQEA